ncbi:MAG: sterol desaturase family protein [Myxococcota bacterium]
MTLATLAFIALGLFAWTFVEYAMHRWLGHDRRFVRRTPFGAEHTAHHSRGDYFAPWWKKALFAALMTSLIGLPMVLAAGALHGLAFTGGLVGGYLAYEALHRLLHVWAGVGAYARWARRHHFFHHFHDPSRNHGVTSPLWDLVFRTHARPARIEVPKKLAMRWLVDARSGDVHAAYAGDYALRGR